MEYQIIDVPAFRIVGYRAKGDWPLEDTAKHAEALWAELVSDGAWRIHDVLSLMDGSEPGGLMGVCASDGYLVGVATSAPCPEGMVERVVDAATYAVFDCTGPLPEAIQELQHRIFAEWLPSSDYEWAPAVDIERYLGANLHADDYHSQVWLPIERRQR